MHNRPITVLESEFRPDWILDPPPECNKKQIRPHLEPQEQNTKVEPAAQNCQTSQVSGFAC